MSGYYALEKYGLGFDTALAATIATTVVADAPAAGQDWSITVPGGVYWFVISLSVIFNTSAAVITRTPTFMFTYSGAEFFSTGAVNQYTANNAGAFNLAVGLGSNQALAGGSQQQLVLPLTLIPSGATIQSVTTGIQAGDTWGPQSLYVRQAKLAGVNATDEPHPSDFQLVATPITL